MFWQLKLKEGVCKVHPLLQKSILDRISHSTLIGWQVRSVCAERVSHGQPVYTNTALSTHSAGTMRERQSGIAGMKRKATNSKSGACDQSIKACR